MPPSPSSPRMPRSRRGTWASAAERSVRRERAGLGVGRLVRAGRLVTVSPMGTIADGAVAIDGDSIAAVGEWRELSAHYPNADVLDAGDLVVTPGLVDCHTHNLEFGAGTKWDLGQGAQFA